MTVRPLLDEYLHALPVDPEEVAQAAELVTCSLRSGGKLLTFGNGGSAACAQHLASEFVGRMSRPRPGMAAIALTTDTSLLTAVANDFGFDQVFSRQVTALGRPEDVALAISTSGRSANLLAGLSSAASAGLSTIALLGRAPSPLEELADVTIHALVSDPQRVQEVHLAVQHALCAAVETELFAAEPPASVGRLLAWRDLLTLRARWRRQGRRLIWTVGHYSTLEPRPVRALSQLREGSRDVLVVGVSGQDADAADRATLVGSLRIVDHAVLLGDRTPAQAAAELDPDLIWPEETND